MSDLILPLVRPVVDVASMPGTARAFLAAYRELGSVRLAAAAAGSHRQTHYDHLRDVEGYAEAFADAKEDAADRLEEEATRRAVEGWEEPVYQKGQLVGTIRKFSDALLLAQLRANRPAKYVHPRAQNVTQIVDARGAGAGHAVTITATPEGFGKIEVSPSRQADYNAFLKLLERAAARRVKNVEALPAADPPADPAADAAAPPLPLPPSPPSA